MQVALSGNTIAARTGAVPGTPAAPASGAAAVPEADAMLAPGAPGIVIVQHTPERYTGAFA
jgi:hypothetical protein